MTYDPNYGEHAFADAEIARDEQWLADMAQYDAEEQAREVKNQNPYESLDHSDEILALYIDRVNTAMLEELRLAYPGGKIPQRALLKAALPKIEQAAAALLQSYSIAIDFYQGE